MLHRLGMRPESRSPRMRTSIRRLKLRQHVPRRISKMIVNSTRAPSNPVKANARTAADSSRQLAAGRRDPYWELGLGPWNVAAGSPLVEQAGGRITKLTGSALNLDAPALLGSNGRPMPRSSTCSEKSGANRACRKMANRR